MATDVEYQREAAHIMAEFLGADAEAARLLAAEQGAFPADTDQTSESDDVATSTR
jgi:hypothetical protein